MLSGRAIGSLDERISDAVDSLPAAGLSRSGDRQRAGILNARAEVYREVDVFTLLDLLHLTARMNVLGYRLAQELRERYSRRYSIIYAPLKRTPSGEG